MNTIITIAAAGAVWTAIASVALLFSQKRQPRKRIKTIDPAKANPPITYNVFPTAVYVPKKK